MKLSDYIINFLYSQKISHVFLFTGGAITHLVDSAFQKKGMHPIVVHHEQAGAFAAEAYARISGNFGVTFATSGPGATNLISGIASAYFDSIPCLYITGQVNTYEYKFEQPVRQIGFQETDIVSIVKPIIKDAVLVTDPQKIRYFLEKAIYTAKSERPGPVLLDIPMDIQRAEIDPDKLVGFFPKIFKSEIAKNEINFSKQIVEVVNKINNSQRPVILIGGGVRLANATAELVKLIDKTNIPVVTSLMGTDGFPHDHAGYIGMLGAYGNRAANFTVANCDLLIVIGSRLTSRQTGTKPNSFARGAEIIHIDIDLNELDRKKSDLKICCDAKKMLVTLGSKLAKYDKQKISKWLKITNEYKKKYPSFPKIRNKNFIDPNFFMKELSDFLKPKDIICLDVGQNQIWAAQSLKIDKTHRVLISGGLGAMGFALPASIGAFMVKSKNRVIAIVGDGGIQINIQELQTIFRYKIPVKIILMNNHSLGMVRHFQELYFGKRYYATIKGYDNPEFAKIANAYKIRYYKITKTKNIRSQLKRALESNESALIEVDLPVITYVAPKLEMNRPIEDQNPLLDRDEFRGNMIIPILE